MSHEQLVADWLAGWNRRELDLLMSHYAEDAVFVSPAVLVRQPEAKGIVRGREAIRQLYRRALAAFPALYFELEDSIERSYGSIIIYRKLGVFAERPGLTVEVLEISAELVQRNTVYWGLEEVTSQFVPRPPISPG